MDYAFKYVIEMMKDLFDIVVALMLIVPFEMIIFYLKEFKQTFHL